MRFSILHDYQNNWKTNYKENDNERLSIEDKLEKHL